MASPPAFETDRLVLRGPTEADASSYERHFVDYAVVRQLARTVPWPYPPGGVLAFLRAEILPRQGQDRWLWVIALKSRPAEVIGAIDLWREGRPEHRGFWLGRAYWGQGLMTEAVRPVLDHAFETLGFEVLVFSNAVGNLRSRRIKEKTGARFLRTEPATFVDPFYTEREVWELSRADWERFRDAASLSPRASAQARD